MLIDIKINKLENMIKLRTKSSKCWTYFFLEDGCSDFLKNEYYQFIYENELMGEPYNHFIWKKSDDNCIGLKYKIHKFPNLLFLSHDNHSIQIQTIFGRDEYELINEWIDNLGFLMNIELQAVYKSKDIVGCTVIFPSEYFCKN